jgi:hypothetical protein
MIDNLFVGLRPEAPKTYSIPSSASDATAIGAAVCWAE